MTINKSEILDRMTLVIADILDRQNLILRPEMTALDIEGWDSLAHINIIVGVEQEFRIKFKLSEIKIMQNIGDFVDLISAKL